MTTKLDDLKQQEFVLSMVWTLEVQNRGVGRATLPRRALGKNPRWPLLPGVVANLGDASACGRVTPPSGFLPCRLLSLCIEIVLSAHDGSHGVEGPPNAV